MNNIKIILLAGGRGGRLWPQSKINNPKPFSISLGGKTLFQHTLERVSFVNSNSIYICTEQNFKQKIIDQAPKFPQKNIIYEPVGKDTATSIFLSSLSLEESDDVLLFIPCDHFIKNQKAFQQTIKDIITTTVHKKSICLIGILPTSPSTEFGYIEISSSNKNNSYFLTKKFHEKPDLKTATKYLSQGNFFWNSGIFACVHNKLNQILSLYGEDLYKNLKKFLAKKECFPFEKTIERCSFDKKVLEKIKPLYCVPALFDWDDVGTWNSLGKYFPKDIENNYSNNSTIFYSSKNIFCSNTEKKLLVIQGCEDLNIINQEDVLYISKKNHNTELKEALKIVEKDYPNYL